MTAFAGFDKNDDAARRLSGDPEGLLLKPGLSDFLVEHGKAMAPLVKWLHANV